MLRDETTRDALVALCTAGRRWTASGFTSGELMTIGRAITVTDLQGKKANQTAILVGGDGNDEVVTDCEQELLKKKK
jgi:hypothetical protein